MIGISSENKKILQSGTVIQFENESIIFSIFDLKYIIKFIDDDDKKKNSIEFEIEKNDMIIKLINFNSTLGVGSTVPLDVGIHEGKKIYFNFRIYSLGDKKEDRMIHYTWYMEI